MLSISQEYGFLPHQLLLAVKGYQQTRFQSSNALFFHNKHGNLSGLHSTLSSSNWPWSTQLYSAHVYITSKAESGIKERVVDFTIGNKHVQYINTQHPPKLCLLSASYPTSSEE